MIKQGHNLYLYMIQRMGSIPTGKNEIFSFFFLMKCQKHDVKFHFSTRWKWRIQRLSLSLSSFVVLKIECLHLKIFIIFFFLIYSFICACNNIFFLLHKQNSFSCICIITFLLFITETHISQCGLF